MLFLVITVGQLEEVAAYPLENQCLQASDVEQPIGEGLCDGAEEGRGVIAAFEVQQALEAGSPPPGRMLHQGLDVLLERWRGILEQRLLLWRGLPTPGTDPERAVMTLGGEAPLTLAEEPCMAG